MSLSEFAGHSNGWAMFRMGRNLVGVDLGTFATTDVLEFSEDGYQWESEDADPDSMALAQFLADEVLFDRTPVPSSARVHRYHAPTGVLAASAAGYASLNQAARDRYTGIYRRLASKEGVTFDDVRSIARYFMAASTDDPAYGVHGGRDGMRWATGIVSQEFAAASGAAAPTGPQDPEVEIDPDAPHQYFAVVGADDMCAFCFRTEESEVHESGAVNYAIAGINPRTAHYYTDGPELDDSCEVCGNPPDHTLHRQAGLANYYENKDEHDRIYAENAKFWDEQGSDPVVASGGLRRVMAAPPHLSSAATLAERALAADAAFERLSLERTDDDEDDVSYWVLPSQSDPMIAERLYLSSGGDYYELDPYKQMWVAVPRLPADTEPVQVDDETGGECVRGMCVAPGHGFDMRLVDPEESALMDECTSSVDWTMVERSLEEFGVGDGMYTPQERSQNASKQMRDKFGRFARTGVSVKTPDGRTGYIALAEPDGRTIHVQHSPDEPAVRYDVRDVEVQNPRDDIREAIDRIPGDPRASENTPKAWKNLLLPPLDTNTMISMMEDYPSYVEMMRAGAPDRDKAWEAYDEESKRKAEERAEAAKKRWQEILSGVKGSSGGSPAAGIWDKISKWWEEDKKRGWVAAALAAAGFTDPTQSDVPPVNMALVSPADPDEVLELLSMVPVSASSSRPVLFRRVAGGKWEQDMKLLRQMQSRTPPSVVVLSPEEFEDVKQQVDGFYKNSEATPEMSMYDEYGAIVAGGIPGIADTPGDIANVNRLKRYWTVGKGGAKIRWNTPGDWTRCNKHLRKYMGPRAKGYCSTLHKLMTGVWPGDRRNIGRKRRNRFSSYIVNTSEGVMSLTAGAAMSSGESPVVAAADVSGGSPFHIKVLAPMGVKSGDGREFSKGALSYREFPIPLLWQMRTEDGHNSSVIVGRIDSGEVLEDGSLGNARGVMDTGKYAREAERLIRNKFLRGVSVDLDEFEATTRSDATAGQPTMAADSDDVVETRIAPNETKITRGRVMAATLVAKPAFQECVIELVDDAAPETAEEEIADGVYVADPVNDDEFESFVASALVAAGVPVNPPSDWFQNPGLTGPTPLTVLDDGRVFGHIATWDTDHIGLPFSTRPPKSRSNYAYFQTGLLKTAEGQDIHVGQITLAGGHAPLDASAQAAAKHYDDTASAVCDVRAGEDAYGIWVAGATRPSVTPEQVRAMRAAAPSGDWRPINGRLELVAVCQVNVPGFPVTRARVASGSVHALVAAGTSALNQLRVRAASEQSGIHQRLASLEADRDAELSAKREAAAAPFRKIRDERAAEARARFAALMADDTAVFRDYSPQQREEYAKEGIALPDGSYPIANVSDLKNAISAYGRAKNKAAARRHIRKRARALGKTDLIPESWGSAAMIGDEFHELASSSPAEALFRDYSQEKREEMEKKGQAMEGGRYPIANVSDLKNAIHAYGRGAPDDKPAIRRHIIKRARALGKTDLIPDSWSQASLEVDAEEISGRVASLIAGGRYPDGTPWDPDRHPRDATGRFRTALATLKKGLGSGESGAKARNRINDAEIEVERGNLDEARKAATDVLKLVDGLSGGPAEGDELLDLLRKGYTDLGTSVANMPIDFGSLSEKFRYTDLPPDLKGLVEDLLSRVESRLEGENKEKATSTIKSFMSGSDMLSQPEISAELARMLRYLI